VRYTILTTTLSLSLRILKTLGDSVVHSAQIYLSSAMEDAFSIPSWSWGATPVWLV
jgi:hypothetical protein